MKKTTIITGDSSFHTDAAVEWLKANGATVEEHAELLLITLPDTMELRGDDHTWRYIVRLKEEEDEESAKYVEVCIHANPFQVEFYLED